MTLELLIIPLIFLFSFVLLMINFNASITLLLVLSTFLHKEVFSIYRWDVLPVRVFMMALLAYGVAMAFKELKKELFSIKNILLRLRRLLSEPFLFLLVLLWFIRGVSLIYTKNFTSSIFLFGFFTTIVCLGILLYIHLKSDLASVLRYIKQYIFIAFILAIVGFIQLLIHHKFDFVFGALWPVPGHTPRVGSLFWDVNHFGSFLASLLPIIGVFGLCEVIKAFFATPTSDLRWRVIPRNLNKREFLKWLIPFVALGAILYLTSSRTAWMLGFFSFLTFIGLLVYRKFKMKGIATIFVVLVFITLPFVREFQIKDSPFRAKVKNAFHYRIDSFDSHILLLRGTAQVFEKYPILGGGYGGFFEHFSKTKVAPVYFGRDPAALNTRVPAHTIWGELISETGVLGLAAYMLLVGLVVGTLIYGSQTLQDPREYLLTAAMASSIIGWMIAGIFYSYKSEFFWLILFFYFIYGVAVLKKDYNLLTVFRFFGGSEKFILLVLVVVSAVLLLFGLGSTHLIPWDEAIYAKVAKNMFESKDYLSLFWVRGENWFEKPPLFMWGMSLFIKYLGVTEFAVRLPSALAGLGTVFITYFFGRRLFNKTAGLLSAFVLLTITQFILYSRSSMLDVGVTFFIVLSLFLYWKALATDRSLFWALSGVAIGFGIMTKGVVGILPFLIIGLYELYRFITKPIAISSALAKNYLYLFISSLVIFLPWHLEMYRQYGTAFTSSYIGYHVLDRAATAIEDKGQSFFWYIVVLRVSMRIWFIALLGAFPFILLKTFPSLLNTRLRQLHTRLSYFADHFFNAFDSKGKYVFLLVYSLTIFFFFSSSKSKLVWYIMPIYPALSLMIGCAIERLIVFLSLRSAIKKALLIYLLFSFALVYLVINKQHSYPGDLTGDQAQLLKYKDEKFGVASKMYVDVVERPLALFYTDGSFEGVVFAGLKEALRTAHYSDEIIFLTKESRFRTLEKDYPNLDLAKRIDDWSLGSLPSQESYDKRDLSRIQQQIKSLERGFDGEAPAKVAQIAGLRLIEQELLEKIAQGIAR